MKEFSYQLNIIQHFLIMQNVGWNVGSILQVLGQIHDPISPKEHALMGKIP